MARIKCGTGAGRRITAAQALTLPLGLARDYVRFHSLRPWVRRPLPLALCLYVTERCNLRCTMCGIWRQRASGPEATLAEFERLLSDPLFKNLEFVNLNGGEPNLRPDLPEIAALLLRKFPRLRNISLNTNGLPLDESVANADAIGRACRDRRIGFSISVSLHGLDETHDAIVGVRQAFSRVLETLTLLRERQFSRTFFLGVNCVISSVNATRLEEFHRWCRGQGLPVNYTLGEVRDRFYNRDMREVVLLDGLERAAAIDFLKRRAAERSPRNHHALRYHVLAEMLERGAGRSLSCHYALGGAILGARGELFYCKQSEPIGNALEESAAALYFRPDHLEYRRRELCGRLCLHCPPNTFNRFELAADAMQYLGFLLKKSGTRLRAPADS
jgi:MoaA/NifB/PqqE/SkfB family radical SAM enzyme